MKKLFAILTFLLLPTQVFANVMQFQQGTAGYSGCQDNWMNDNAAGGRDNMNEGGHNSIVFGNESGFGFTRALMRWNLSQIPATATVTAATLTLYDQDYVNRNLNNPINIYQPSASNADWTVGTSVDATEVGASCWNKKVYNTTNWAGSAGLSTATTDYVNTSLASYTFVDGRSGLTTINFNSDGVAYIQTLLGGTGGAGFLIIGDQSTSNTLTGIESANASTVSQRPILTITFTGPPKPITITQGAGGNIIINQGAGGNIVIS